MPRDDSYLASALSIRQEICCLFYLTILACFGILLLSLSAGAQDGQSTAPETESPIPDPQGEELDLVFSDFENYTKKTLSQWHVPGLAVAVVKGDQIIYLHCFGNRSKDGPDPVTQNTVFQVGSTSKAFTAALLAQLVDEGKLQWTDRVIDHLPEFQLYDPWVTREFMVKDLLDHSSGLPDHACDDLITLGYDRETVMRSLRQAEPTISFRSGYNYSNVLYLWAARLIEVKSGLSWEENLQKRIFEPLQMANSSSGLEAFLEEREVASLHMRKDNRVSNPDLLTIPMNWTYMDWIYIGGPAGGINSNIVDMAKWLRLHMAASRAIDEANSSLLISQENLRYMHNPHIIMTPGGKLYSGLGWIYEEYRPYPIVWHNGGSFGHHSMIAFMPEGDIGIVILSNSDNGVPEILAYWFFDRYWGNPERDYSNESMDQALLIESLTDAAWPKRPESFDLALPLERYAGNYTSDIYGPMNITAEGDRLVALMGPRELRCYMYPWNRDMFQTQVPDFLNKTGFAAFRVGIDGVPHSLEMTLFIEAASGRRAKFNRLN